MKNDEFEDLMLWGHSLNDFCEMFNAIFNASVREGFVPPCWKEAHVTSVQKVHPPKTIE